MDVTETIVRMHKALEESSLAVRFAVLLFGVTVPFCAFIGFSALRQQSLVYEHALQQSLSIAQLMASRLDAHVQETETLLGRLAHDVVPEFNQKKANEQFLKSIESVLPEYINNIYIWDLEGQNVGILKRLDADLNLNEPIAHLLTNMTGVDQIAVAVSINSHSKERNVAIFTRPIIGVNGKILGAISVSTGLKQIQEFLNPEGITPDGTLVTVFDSQQRTILVRSIDPEKWVGEKYTNEVSGHDVFEQKEESGEQQDVDGVLRLSSYVPLRRVPWIVSVSFPADIFIEMARRNLYVALVLGAILTGISVVVAVAVGRSINTPIEILSEGARRMGAGDLSYRIPLDLPPDFMRLAQTMNRMAIAVQERSDELARSEQWLKSVTDAVPAMIAYIDQHQCYRFANRHYNTLLGIDPTWMIGKHIREVLGPNVFAMIEVYGDLALRGTPAQFEYTIMARGEPRHLLANFLPDFGPSREVLGFFVLNQDITPLRTALRELADRDARLRAITDNVPVRIGYVNQEHVLTFANKAFTQFALKGLETVIGKRFADAFGEDLYRTNRPYFERALSGEIVHFERHVEINGRTRIDDVTYTPDLDQSGTVRGFYGMTYDITEVKRLELEIVRQKDRLSLITDNVPALISYLDPSQRFQFANKVYLDWFGREPGSMIGLSLEEFYGTEVYAGIKEHIETGLSGEQISYERAVSTLDGQKQVRVTVVPDIVPDSGVRGLYVLMSDISDLNVAMKRLSASEQQLRTIANNLPVLISYIDSSHIFRFNNLMFERWLRRPIVKITNHMVRDVLGDTTYARLLPFLNAGLSGETVKFDLEFQDWDNVPRVAHCIFIPDIDANANVNGVHGLIRDVTSSRQTKLELTRAAFFDSLTGLPNRSQFTAALVKVLKNPDSINGTTALMFLDLDHFKEVNDTYGHQIGDDVLKHFASRLQSNVRPPDMAARLAGDEFVVLLVDLNDVNEIQHIATRILAAMRTPITIGDYKLSVATSIGIAIRRTGEDDPSAFLRRADEALYQAKAVGRNGFVISA